MTLTGTCGLPNSDQVSAADWAPRSMFSRSNVRDEAAVAEDVAAPPRPVRHPLVIAARLHTDDAYYSRLRVNRLPSSQL
eukprot:7430934-Alexandrium_andersonii.AAC.1